jgi:hypothetical protein
MNFVPRMNLIWIFEVQTRFKVISKKEKGLKILFAQRAESWPRSPARGEAGLRTHGPARERWPGAALVRKSAHTVASWCDLHRLSGGHVTMRFPRWASLAQSAHTRQGVLAGGSPEQGGNMEERGSPAWGGVSMMMTCGGFTASRWGPARVGCWGGCAATRGWRREGADFLLTKRG